MNDAPPLAGKRVLLARAAEQSDATARLVRDRGAEPVVIPTIAVGPPDDGAPLREALRRLSEYAWVVFTSANGVELTWRALQAEGLTKSAFGGAKFVVVGTATRDALEGHGARVHRVAREFRGEGVAAALLESMRDEGTGRVLILRAQEANAALTEALVAAGVAVDDVAVYRTRALPDGAREVRRRLEARAIDVIVFASGSTVDSVCDALGPDLEPLLAVTIVCLGPVTATAARARGVKVDVVPKIATFAAAMEALEEHFRAI